MQAAESAAAERAAGDGPTRPLSQGSAAGDIAGGGSSKALITVTALGVVLILDMLTKAWVVNTLVLYSSTPVWGEFFRFTYTHNRGAAFGINVGEHSRYFFLVLALIALVVLGTIYRATPAWDRLRVLALSLVGGGAIGNIIDRIRYEAGVVDFLDFGIGDSRFPVFNVADSAVTVGATLLLISFWLEGKRERAEASEDAEST